MIPALLIAVYVGYLYLKSKEPGAREDKAAFTEASSADVTMLQQIEDLEARLESLLNRVNQEKSSP